MKKNNNMIFWIVGIILVLMIVNYNSNYFAVSTNATQKFPLCTNSLASSCYVYSDLILKNQNYKAVDNYINILGNSIIIDCNGATFTGTGSETVFKADGVNSITIKNCNFNNVKYPFYITNSQKISIINSKIINDYTVYFNNVKYLSIINSIFDKSKKSNIYLDANADNLFLKNNTFLNAREGVLYSRLGFSANNAYIGYNNFKVGGLMLLQFKDSIIEYNSFNNAYSGWSYYGIYGVYSNGGKNNKFRYNSFKNDKADYNRCLFGAGNPSGLCFDLFVNDYGSEIYNNDFYNNSNRASITLHGSTLTKVHNNVINLNERGIWITESSNIEVYKNTISNSVLNFDGYDSAISAEYSVYRSSIHDNTITNYGTYGIFLRNVITMSVTGNSINAMPASSEKNYPVVDQNEYRCAIGNLEMYKTWWGDGSEGNTYSKYNNYASDSIILSKNKFGSNVQCLFRNQGGTNIKNDLKNYYLRSFNVPGDFARDDIYFNIKYSTLDAGKNLKGPTPFAQGYRGVYYVYYLHGAKQDYYKNINAKSIIIYPVKAKKITQNSKIICSSNCKSVYTINLNPNDEVYIYY